jgi:ribosome-binding factor A
MKTYKRADRVRHLIQQEISRILQREVKDPRVQFVTVTNCKLADDLREARVFVSILSAPDERDDIFRALQRATRFIRGELGRQLKLKYTPAIQFVLDDSWDKQERILNLLDSIHHEQEGETTSDE